MELDKKQKLAALEGWASNRGVPMDERLQVAMQVIKGLREFLDYCPFEYSSQHYECLRNDTR
jgi:hypothetical protein